MSLPTATAVNGNLRAHLSRLSVVTPCKPAALGSVGPIPSLPSKRGGHDMATLNSNQLSGRPITQLY